MSLTLERGIRATSPTAAPPCASEPIHAPGAIQAWGALLIAGEDDRIVRHASANLAAFIERPAAAALGQPLEAVLDPAEIEALLNRSDRPAANAAAIILRLPSSGRPAATLSLRRDAGFLRVEIEAAPPAGARENHAAAPLLQAGDETALLAALAAETRRATNFGRVMAYRFDAEGNGEVAAEDRAENHESLLGRRFPASDIPPPARLLYLRQRVRVIADTWAEPVPLLSAPPSSAPPSSKSGAGDAPDLSLSVLRAPSPVHLDMLRDMGVRATLAVSLAVDGALWGMIVCHDRQARVVPAQARAICDAIGLAGSRAIALAGSRAIALSRA